MLNATNHSETGSAPNSEAFAAANVTSSSRLAALRTGGPLRFGDERLAEEYRKDALLGTTLGSWAAEVVSPMRSVLEVPFLGHASDVLSRLPALPLLNKDETKAVAEAASGSALPSLVAADKIEGPRRAQSTRMDVRDRTVRPEIMSAVPKVYDATKSKEQCKAIEQRRAEAIALAPEEARAALARCVHLFNPHLIVLPSAERADRVYHNKGKRLTDGEDACVTLGLRRLGNNYVGIIERLGLTKTVEQLRSRVKWLKKDPDHPISAFMRRREQDLSEDELKAVCGAETARERLVGVDLTQFTQHSEFPVTLSALSPS